MGIDLYRENVPEGITFTRCMKRVEATAEQLWSTDLSRDMHPVYNPKGAGKGEGKLHNVAKRLQKGAGNKAAKAKGAGRKGGGKGAAGKATTSAIKLGQTATVAIKKVKTARSNGSNTFCSYFK